MCQIYINDYGINADTRQVVNSISGISPNRDMAFLDCNLLPCKFCQIVLMGIAANLKIHSFRLDAPK